MTPEQKARVSIDALLVAAGWHVCKVADANIHAGDGVAKGVAIREFPLNNGFGFADYLLYVNGKACGVIEAKKEGTTLTGVELQSSRYAQGLPDAPFIGMEHVEAHTMKLLGTVPAATMKSSAVHFKAGDVLYGRLRP